jgi:hypothetical protein
MIRKPVVSLASRMALAGPDLEGCLGLRKPQPVPSLASIQGL